MGFRFRFDWRLVLGLVGGVLAGGSSGQAGEPPGDLDCDGLVMVSDVAPFVTALIDPDAYADAFPDCAIVLADLNGDGRADGADVAAFIAALVADPLPGPLRFELAGDRLAAYPFFDFVRAFNQGAPIHITVDPTRHPGLVSRSCDLYVVTARSAEQWGADPVLVDVRATGAQAITIVGGTVQANTIEIEGGALLTGAGGVPLGTGYDLVLDCDGDGLLGSGDVIDGLSDEAGMYVLPDLTATGPYATESATYELLTLDDREKAQRLYYPADVAALGPRPVVFIGHGISVEQNLFAYEYLQEHLASHGFIVVSHQNAIQVQAPIVGEVAHDTDAFIARQDSIAGGALDGLIDATRIAWIGHSFGGLQMVHAYTALVKGDYVPQFYDRFGIRCISAMAANSGDVFQFIEMHDVAFHLILGAADGTISGNPGCDQCLAFKLFDRAPGIKTSTYIHGAGHEAFTETGGAGPIGQAQAHAITKAAYLALLKHFLEDSIPAKDVLARPWERFRPIGVDPDSVVVSMYTLPVGTEKFVIDDFQSQPGVTTSSAGGAVTFDVDNLAEDLLRDTDGTLDWNPGDPMNGMTYGGPMDATRGLIFDWPAGETRFIEFEVPEPGRDTTPFWYLSLRACQQTRHPLTLADAKDLTFTVTLEDGHGVSSTINIGAYGGGIEQPAVEPNGMRQNEFETHRIRLSDFLANGSGLDLTDVVAIRFTFGGAGGTTPGRVGMDDLEWTPE